MTPVQPDQRSVVARAATVLTALAAVAALAVAVWLYVANGSFVLLRAVATARTSHLDFETFWLSARALLAGTDIYATGAAYDNLNPPLLSVLLAPLGLLDFLPGYRTLVLVTIALVVGSATAIAAELGLPAKQAVPATAAILLSSPVIASVGLGQIYGFLTAGLTGAWLLERHGRPILAGIAVGLVVALKPSLAPLLLVPAVRRHWDVLTAALVTAGGATVGSVLLAGPDSFATWIRLLSDTPTTTYFDNASLPAALLRLTSTSDWGRAVVELPGGGVAGLVLGLLLVAATAWRARQEPGSSDTALWAMAAAALLASPLTWHNYLMVVMPGALVVLARGARATAALLLALALIGMEWPPWWYGPDGTASAVPLTLYTAILLAYWAALLPRRAADAVPVPLGVEPDPRPEIRASPA